MKEAQNDSELIRMYRNGNIKAFGILAERYYDLLTRIIQNRVSDRETAEDLVQDTFLKAMKSILNQKYNEETNFKAWIIKIGTNATVDYYRKKKMDSFSNFPEGEFGGNVFEDTLASDRKNPCEKMIQQETRHYVRRLIKRLPESQQQMVTFRHYEELSFNEIVERTKIPINTALSQMRYALINMRKYIADGTVRDKYKYKKIA